ncbi:SRPBCC domain-containing protein [Niveispirillum sp.]|uniref:SRPBCC family protein n=1 Tax=Niveispirillum sp. TaxID=1917217 RepID=UPI001B47FC29|nr:SRPBCC domain-containing protein [Niveispirillum sp.]MBP7337259.1 SRPBCC domain-containing protein [Niveispirillum sp.]
MTDILHRIGFKNVAPEAVFNALVSVEGLSRWWTEGTTGRGEAVGGSLHFGFGDRGFFDMQVVAVEAPTHLRWLVTDGPAEWIGTHVTWDLRREGDYTILLFRHEGWREPVEFMHHCSTKWGIFLLSLKDLLEGRTAAPWPRDIHIDDWCDQVAAAA